MLLQAATDISARLNALEAAAKSAQSAGDNAWMLTSAALVLMMTGPGLALFYGGLVRRKNVLSTMMHSFIMMALITVIWAIAGYSLVFSEGTPFIGGLKYAVPQRRRQRAQPGLRGTIPQATFMIYQLMFAVITPALISGAYAERMRFSAMLLFTTLWAFVVYFPMAHMVWGKGGLLNAYLGGSIRTFDFAGGTVVHITSGVSALVCALYLGKRHGYPQEPIKPHSLVLSVVGACLLVGGLVRLQRGQRTGGLRPRHQRLRRHPLRGRRGGARLDAGRMAALRQTQHAGRNLRRGSGPGGHHPRLRFRQAHARPADRLPGGDLLFLDGHRGQDESSVTTTPSMLSAFTARAERWARS